MYVHDAQPGLRRYRQGKGFIYRDAHGRRVTRAKLLERIRQLAIPPAYKDVWICADPRGHLQATGRDAKGRKQYRYHPRWRHLRDADKFSRVTAFGAALPRLRRRVRDDLARPGWPKEKVLALVIRLLDDTLIRVGNEAYAQEHGSFGLTTLRARHLHPEPGKLRLHFRAKSGQAQDLTLTEPRLVRLLRRLQQLPGQRLFQYRDDDGKRHVLDSGMVNAYLREVTGGEFTAKDFRTWSATVKAAGLLADTELSRRAGESRKQALLKSVIAAVAAALHHTPTVCRSSYIHPRVIAGWEDGTLQRYVKAAIAHHPRQLEAATLRFLRRHGRPGRSHQP
ncbi:DNA topoisomerase IB [Dyella sp. 2RAB6]|uniref:DNA topoisomerase IB n=1 Tax=Dyella sp. 2RAB6 TaxID=3232992 RepID=UPI003F93BEE6